MSNHNVTPPALAPEKIPDYLAGILAARQERASRTAATAAQAEIDLAEWVEFMEEGQVSESENAKLIAEARDSMKCQEWMPASLAIRMADALEAAEAELEGSRADAIGKHQHNRTLNRWREEVEAERDAALAVIEQAKRWSAQPGCGTPMLDRILATAPADALAEHDRVIAEKAWDAGALANAMATLPDAAPLTNPYRANPEPIDSTSGAVS